MKPGIPYKTLEQTSVIPISNNMNAVNIIHLHYPKIYFSIITPQILVLPNGPFTSFFRTKILFSFPLNIISATCPHVLFCIASAI
jgi:hypothetical protein